MYIQVCLYQRRHFSRFVVSCDRVLENEAKEYYKTVQDALAKNSGKPYSETTNFMKLRMSIVIRATHLCTRSRIHMSRMSHNSQWKYGPLFSGQQICLKIEQKLPRRNKRISDIKYYISSLPFCVEVSTSWSHGHMSHFGHPELERDTLKILLPQRSVTPGHQ